MEKDYYNILNINPPSNEEEVKQAYRKLAKKYHPDVNHLPEAHVKFIEITEAYEYLLEQLKITVGKTVNYEDDLLTREYFEEMRRKSKERAREKARIKAEKIQKEHEAYQESGLYDFVLLASYIGRYLVLFLCIFLVFWSVINSFGFTESTYVVRVLVFLCGTTGTYFILKAGKKYLFPGKFYYNFKKIRKTLFYRNSKSKEYCYYSPKYKADSLPYKIGMFKIKDIKLHNYGPAQHGVSFDQKNISLDIPRSHHAFVVHFVLIAVKLIVLVYCMIFLEINSFIWRFIIAVLLSLVISNIILVVTRTKSTVSFLLTIGLIIRSIIWLLFILLFSFIHLKPFNIYTSEHIHAVTVFILLFDSFLDQFLNFISAKKFRMPLIKQPPIIEVHLEKKYQFGYDMPVISVFYPVYKWFLG